MRTPGSRMTLALIGIAGSLPSARRSNKDRATAVANKLRASRKAFGSEIEG